MPAPAALTLAPSPTLTDPAPLRIWIDAAAQQYRGRLAVLRALALASVCPRPVNVLLLGPPGTAKTALANGFAGATGARFLGATLSPWTDAAELLGPVDLTALAAGRLERATAGRPTLATADLVLLDELSRAAPGIRALTLPVLSDRRTPTGDAVPAHVIVAGANTRLTSEEDAALVDRFALRVDVPRLMSAPNLRHVLLREVPTGGVAPTAAPLPPLPAGLVQALRAQAASVDLPADVGDALTTLALALRQPAPTGASYPDVSERRWILATRLLQASATLAGRPAVDWADLVDTLPMILDDGPDSRPAIRNAIDSSIPRWVRALGDLDAACVAAVARARRVGGANTAPGVDPMRPGDGDAHAKFDEELSALAAPLHSYGADVQARAADRAARARDEVDDAYSDAMAAGRAARRR